MTTVCLFFTFVILISETACLLLLRLLYKTPYPWYVSSFARFLFSPNYPKLLYINRLVK